MYLQQIKGKWYVFKNIILINIIVNCIKFITILYRKRFLEYFCSINNW
jgi:hypothetical protein